MPALGQITVRAPVDLILRVKHEAATEGKSMNEYVTHLLAIAVDPAHATTADERLVARLRSAGILAEPEGGAVERPPQAAIDRARRAAATNTPAPDLVSMDRGE